MKATNEELLEQLFVLEGIFFDPHSVEEVEQLMRMLHQERFYISLHKAVEELITTVEEVRSTNFLIHLLSGCLCRICGKQN